MRLLDLPILISSPNALCPESASATKHLTELHNWLLYFPHELTTRETSDEKAWTAWNQLCREVEPLFTLISHQCKTICSTNVWVTFFVCNPLFEIKSPNNPHFVSAVAGGRNGGRTVFKDILETKPWDKEITSHTQVLVLSYLAGFALLVHLWLN